MTYHARVTDSGEVVLPADLAREIGLTPGGRFQVEHRGRALDVEVEGNRESALGRLRSAMKGYSVDQFLAERRADWGEGPTSWTRPLCLRCSSGSAAPIR